MCVCVCVWGVCGGVGVGVALFVFVVGWVDEWVEVAFYLIWEWFRHEFGMISI